MNNLKAMTKRVYEIDGSDSSTLQEFAADFTDKLNLEIDWHGIWMPSMIFCMADSERLMKGLS